VHCGNHVRGQAQRRDDGGDGLAVVHGLVESRARRQRGDEFPSRRDDIRLIGAVIVIFRFRNHHLAELHSVPVPAITVIIRADFGPVAPAGFKLGHRA
jgi:hypothetical protein